MLTKLIKELEQTTGFQRIINLCNCINTIAASNDYTTLSTGMVRQLNAKDNGKIEKIVDFTINSFKRQVGLAKDAGIANMSVPAFCNYFKKCTRKTYINFLNVVRIGYACRMLVNTDKNIKQVCFESGFQSLQNFNKQFYKLQKATP